MSDAKVKIILVNILRERTRLGFTQEYMGYKMGISQNAYSKIELGYTAITVNSLFKIADIFGCPVEKLLENL
jgi:transcriptional regulator with XRE-family HTH domain